MAVTYHTADMVRALPDDGQRHEVVRGELVVTPAPRPLHQRTVTRLVAAVKQYLEVRRSAPRRKSRSCLTRA